MTGRVKKRFGQHFLRDSGTLERIVRLIRPRPEDRVLEIGAGQGALSVRLAPLVARLIALEIDRDCIAPLRAALEPFPSAVVEQGDILTHDLSELATHLEGKKLRLVGNLPFNIATTIIERILESDLPVEDMIVMAQLEVAQRIAAFPGSRDYGYFSIYCQHRADVRIEFKVSPACFVPRPRVTSAMVTLRPKPRAFDPALEKRFQELAKAAFSHRRKTLANSLTNHPEFAAITHRLLSVTGIDGVLRPEQLSVADYERLAQALVRLEHFV